MNLIQRFRQIIQEQLLFHATDRLLIAVSGGVDSVVLCALCKEAGYDFTIAHCNFQLRGGESERDEHFVQAMGHQYGVGVMIKRFDTEKYAQESKKGIQEAARDLRYAWFKEIIDDWPLTNPKPATPGYEQPEVRKEPAQAVAHFLLTAHHADDNIETALMNFCRGTGLNGLEGIQAKHGFIRRPLLSFWKKELVDFAQEHNLEFVEDSSNQSVKYTRNLFRNEIIPLISRTYPTAKENIQGNIHRFREINGLYRMSVQSLRKKLCSVRNNEVHIPIKKLMSYDNSALIYEIISEFGFAEKQVDEVIKLAASESGKFIKAPSAPFRIIKYRNWFIVSAEQSIGAETIIIEEGAGLVIVQQAKLKIEIVQNAPGFTFPASGFIACLDANEISYPLILRRPKVGDYFYPLGMKKKKKVARFFIDQKRSKTEREESWVLEMNKKIIWVAGLRIDDRFKVTERTKTILKMTLEAT